MVFDPREPKTWEDANPALQERERKSIGALCQACCYALGGVEVSP